MKMRGVVLPGNRRVEMHEYEMPKPDHGQVLLKMKASSICGSDIRAIYREHLGVGAEGYRNVIAGHEPSGQIVELGPGCKRFSVGDRVTVYHISGCGVCNDCRKGYMISCTSAEHRAAYGWQRDGGHADYMLAEENTCILLPEPLSYVDGALVACGFGTVYEALNRMRVSGEDRVLITGVGPVGMAAGLVARAMGTTLVIGVDISPSRLEFAQQCGAIDHAIPADGAALERVKALTQGEGCEVSVDCSGSSQARLLALHGTRRWGRCAMVGAGNDVTFDIDHTLMQPQLTIYGSWVTSLGHMEDLVQKLVEWQLRPEIIVSHRFALDQAEEAYRVADAAQSGKVCIVMD